MPKWNQQQKYVRARIVSIHFYILVTLLFLNEFLISFFLDVQWSAEKGFETFIIIMTVLLSINITLMYRRVFQKNKEYALINTFASALLTILVCVVLFTQNSPFIQQGLIQPNIILFILLLQFIAQTLFSALSYRENIAFSQKKD